MYLTIEEIRSWEIDKEGFYVSPNNQRIKLRNGVEIGDDVKIGYRVEIEDETT